MKILFLGGDLRYIPIIENLNKCHEVHLVGYSNVDTSCSKKNINDIELSDYNVIFFPMGGINDNLEITSLDGKILLNASDLMKIKNNTIVFTGLVTGVMKELQINKVISFLSDKEIRENNNDVTVDGIMNKIEKYSNDKICILGYGNIGKKVYEKISNKNISVVVGVKKSEDLRTLKNSFSTLNQEDFLYNVSTSDIIINTVPENIITKDILNNISDETYIIDIASYPHGVNQNLIKKNDKKYDLYLGIPGKVNPEKSGKVLLKKVKNMLGG